MSGGCRMRGVWALAFDATEGAEIPRRLSLPPKGD